MSQRALKRLEARFRREDEARLKRGLQHLVSDADGRYWLWKMMETARVFHNPHSSENPHQTSFLCGMQNMGQMLLAQLVEEAPDAYMGMMKEQSEENARREHERRKRADDGDDDSPGDDDSYE